MRLSPSKLAVLAALCQCLTFAQTPANTPSVITIDATKSAGAPFTTNLRMGGSSPSGHRIGVNNRFLTFDGKPWLPVMGEFHYSRYPEQYWEEELLKMKAGGVQVISTYVFWIHHEEIEGQFDWSGRRNLRHVVELCQKHGLYAHVRIGPYAHGEVRNGGLPDWLLAKGPVRKNDPVYLSFVRRYFGEIGKQLQGLLWKDGGPITGIQLENEYKDHSPNGGAAHILELKKIASQSGIEAPLYTVTGWDHVDFPAGEVVPVFGCYPDAFWESSLTDLPPSSCYLFDTSHDGGDLGGTQGSAPLEKSHGEQYPFLLAEAGGGMQVAYHRRPVLKGDDVAAITLTHLGSGANLYGYYMFQGGANPEGKLATLQESEASDHVYDLPVVSYDFQAPLGEFGRLNPSFRTLKLFHLFLQDFGSYLAPMVTVSPEIIPKSAEDNSTPRLAARIQDDHGFLFINNYQRLYPLPERHNIQIQLKLPSETLTVPRRPVGIPSGAYFVWPVNMDLGGPLMKYATAQPLTKLQEGKTEYYFFFAQPEIVPEFAFDANTVVSVEAPKASVTRSNGRYYVNGLEPGADVAVTVYSRTGRTVQIVVLNRHQAENTWKASVRDHQYVFFSPADVFFDGPRLHLRARDVRQLRLSVFPNLEFRPVENVPLRLSGRDGIFWQYTTTVQSREIPVHWQMVRKTAPSAPIKKGKYNALAPTDSDFDRAGLWRIVLPENAMRGLSDAFLEIEYAGDVARLYAGSRLLSDDFYKGTTWEIGLKRFGPDLAQGLDLRVMPLRKDAPIYLPRDAWPPFPSRGEISEVRRITASPEYEVLLEMSVYSKELSYTTTGD